MSEVVVSLEPEVVPNPTINVVIDPPHMEENPEMRPTPQYLKLDLGCGQTPREGFEGVDLLAPNAKYKVDLFKFPWPFADGEVGEVHCAHFFEHVPGNLRFAFMDELYRVMKMGGTAFFITPYGMSTRAIQDPTHEWPPIVEASYLYFNEPWRIQNRLDHYPVRCSFDFAYGFAINPNYHGRNQEYLARVQREAWNVIDDLHVTLTKVATQPREPKQLMLPFDPVL